MIFHNIHKKEEKARKPSKTRAQSLLKDPFKVYVPSWYYKYAYSFRKLRREKSTNNTVVVDVQDQPHEDTTRDASLRGDDFKTHLAPQSQHWDKTLGVGLG